MRFLNIFVLLCPLVAGCAHHDYTGPKKDKGSLARVSNNIDAIEILAVDGKEPKKYPIFQSDFNSYLEPGIHRFTIKHSHTSYIPLPGGGLVGLASSKEPIEDICFNLKAGASYLIESTKNKDGSFAPDVSESTAFLSFEPVELIPCK